MFGSARRLGSRVSRALSACVQALCDDPLNVVFILSGSTRDVLASEFGCVPFRAARPRTAAVRTAKRLRFADGAARLHQSLRADRSWPALGRTSHTCAPCGVARLRRRLRIRPSIARSRTAGPIGACLGPTAEPGFAFRPAARCAGSGSRPSSASSSSGAPTTSTRHGPAPRAKSPRRPVAADRAPAFRAARTRGRVPCCPTQQRQVAQPAAQGVDDGWLISNGMETLVKALIVAALPFRAGWLPAGLSIPWRRLLRVAVRARSTNCAA